MAWKLRQHLLLRPLDSFLHIWFAWSFVSNVYCCFTSDNACLIKFSVHRMLFALTQFGLNHTFVCALPTEAERVVGWARNHHLGLCLSDPPTNKGKLIIPQNMLSLQFHFSRCKLCLWDVFGTWEMVDKCFLEFQFARTQ